MFICEILFRGKDVSGEGIIINLIILTGSTGSAELDKLVLYSLVARVEAEKRFRKFLLKIILELRMTYF